MSATAATTTTLERGVFVGGSVEPLEGEPQTIRNPATGAVVGRVTSATPEIVDRAVKAAHAAFPEWSRRSISERGAILRAGAEAFAARVDELAAAHPDVVVDRRGPWPPYSFAMLEQQ